MKKYFSILLLIVFIVPAIASASWWNPFSWKVFKKKQVAPQVQIINTEKTSEQKIDELQKQIDELNNKKPNIQKLEPIVSKKNSKEISNSGSNLVNCNGQNYTNTCPSLGKEFVCYSNMSGCATKTEIDSLFICNGKAFSKCLNNQNSVCPSNGDAYCKDNSVSNLNNVLSDINKNLQSNLDASQKAQKEKEDYYASLKNSPECISATNKLFLKENEYKIVNDRLSQITNMTQEKGDLSIKSSLLSSEIYSITLEKYKACSNYVPTPEKTYNTDCYYIGYTLHCSTN